MSSDRCSVMRMKTEDLETALNDMHRAGWSVQSVIPAYSSLFGSGVFIFGRGTLRTIEYHVVFVRNVAEEADSP